MLMRVQGKPFVGLPPIWAPHQIVSYILKARGIAVVGKVAALLESEPWSINK